MVASNPELHAVEALRASSAPPEPRAAVRPRVLVVDDDEDLREMYCLALAELGFDVTPCASGDEALAAARAKAPDIVVTDVAMPGLDGNATTRAIKVEWPDVVVIVMTAYGATRYYDAARAAGCDAFVCKPVDPVEVSAVVRCVRERRAAERALAARACAQ
ncbi:MAG TPA: response regulator [Polyangiaceae bacterium]